MKGVIYLKKNVWTVLQNLLLDGISYKKITVNMICQHSTIHRSTFYRLFTDKYDLLEYGINILWREYFRMDSYVQLTHPFQTAATFLNRSMAKYIIKAQMNDLVFLEEVQRITFKKISTVYKETFSIDYFLAGYIVTTIEYIESACKENQNENTLEEKDALFYRLIVKNYFE